MTEKQLIAKLNSMKNVSLDASWLKGHRDVLYTQIENTGAAELSAWEKLVCELRALTMTASRPAFSIASILLVVATFGVFSHRLFSNAKPNESLYIARVISEKAKVNMTFNDDNRNRLEAKFAASHAQDIAAALTDESVSNDPERAKDLSDKFDKEIETVRESLAKVTPVISSGVSVETIAGDAQEQANVGITADDGGVFVADSSKDDSGIKISEPGSQAGSIQTPVKVETPAEGEATTTVETEIAATSSTNIADEVKLYFDKKDYNGAIDKLKELEESIK